MGLFDFLKGRKKPSIVGFGERIGYGKEESIHTKIAKSLLRSSILVVNSSKIRDMLTRGKITAIALKEDEVGNLAEKLLNLKHTKLLEDELGLKIATERLPGRFLMFIDKEPNELKDIVRKIEFSGIDNSMKQLLKRAFSKGVITDELGKKIVMELEPKRRIGSRIVEKLVPKRAPKLPWAARPRPKPK